MKTNTTTTTNNTTEEQKRKRRAGIIWALLALLAIGIGVIYFRDRRPSTTETVAVQSTPAPVAVPVPEPTVVTPVDNAIPAAVPVVAVAPKRHRAASTRTKRAVVTTDEQVGIVTTDTYGGNLPPAAAPLPVVAATPVPEPPKVVTAKKVETKTEVTTTTKASKYGRVNIAPEVGGNLNGLYNNNTSNLLTNGFHAGGMVNISLGNRFALQPGARYIMKGNETKSTTTVEGLEVNTTQKTTLHYAEMPLNLVYKFGDVKGKPRFMVGAGPYVAYLVDATNKVEAVGRNSEGFEVGKTNTTVKPAYENVDAGVGGFIGCQLPKGLYGKAGAEYGLMDLQKNSITGKPSDRNYNFLISVGYIIGSKGKVY